MKNHFLTTNNVKPSFDGETLVSEFLSVITNLTTAKTAIEIAQQSESATLRSIAAIQPRTNEMYVTPGDVPAVSQESLVRDSLDAHLQKVQAEQIDALVQTQNKRLQQDIPKYLKRKVTIGVIDASFQPIESYWFNSRTGQYDQGTLKASTIGGVISEISFLKNVIVVKPSLGSRILLPKRKFFMVYVINPQTLLPAIKISL